MKNFKSILWGLVLVVIGVLLGLKSLEIIKFDIFFDGWWTLFIIVPSIIDLFTEEDKTGSIIGVAIGTALLLACNDILSFDIIWQLLLPAIIVIIGLSIIFKNSIMSKMSEKAKLISKDGTYTAVFSGQKLNYTGEKFEGSNLSAIFGGIDLDLREAIIDEDVRINITSVFGGVDIKVPKNCKVKVTSSSIFGGVDNKINNKEKDESSKTIYINAICVFGGVDIKC